MTPAQARPRTEEVKTEAEQGYQGVTAPKRKRVEDAPIVDSEIPKWLAIKEEDDEKTKAKKRKLLKSYKSKLRFQVTMDCRRRPDA